MLITTHLKIELCSDCSGNVLGIKVNLRVFIPWCGLNNKTLRDWIISLSFRIARTRRGSLDGY